jgi:hypothetical protein
MAISMAASNGGVKEINILANGGVSAYRRGGAGKLWQSVLARHGAGEKYQNESAIMAFIAAIGINVSVTLSAKAEKKASAGESERRKLWHQLASVKWHGAQPAWRKAAAAKLARRKSSSWRKLGVSGGS